MSNVFSTFVEILLCSSIYSNFIRFHMCFKRIYIVQLFCIINLSLSLSLYICIYVYTYIHIFKFAYDIFYIIMVFFIYELLRRKSENDSSDCKFAISPYNLSICFTDFEAMLYNTTFKLSKFFTH